MHLAKSRHIGSSRPYHGSWCGVMSRIKPRLLVAWRDELKPVLGKNPHRQERLWNISMYASERYGLMLDLNFLDYHSRVGMGFTVINLWDRVSC